MIHGSNMRAAPAQLRERLFENRNERALRPVASEQALSAGFNAAAGHRPREAAVDVSVDHRGVDVALAAHRLGVTQLLCDAIDCFRETVLAASAQRFRGEEGPRLGANVVAR